ncbi:MAG: TMEM175 family protein, partial [Bacteroidota bacterium]|nr:TMEM175 family protein [Bacteroidota bacterium]
MIREKITGTNLGKEKGFRWRGDDISRIEGFSDNVFGFALTLLVVTLEVPRTFSQLEESLHGFVAFALAFALLAAIWYDHYKYFRRYGLNDGYVTVLNFALLFMIVFFVYPLKFLFTFLVGMVSGDNNEIALPNGTMVKIIENEQWTTMMITYSLGFVIIFAIFFLLYLHAFRLRGELELSETEIIKTKGEMAGQLANISIGMISVLTVAFGGYRYTIISGLIYWLVGPARAIIGMSYGRKV